MIRLFIAISLLLFCACSNDDTTQPLLPPEISGISADSLVYGESLVIQGANFSSNIAENQINFAGAFTYPEQASTSELEVIVPTDAETGRITVMVSNQSATSEDTLFILDDIPREDLIFFATFDETPEELLENRQGTVNGTTMVQDRFGRGNSAISFNGLNDYLYYPNQGLSPTNGLTVSLWVLVNNIQTTPLISNQERGGFGITLADGTNPKFFGSVMEHEGTSGRAEAVNGGEVQINTWTNISMTFDGKDLALYQNGQLIAIRRIELQLTETTKERMFLGTGNEEEFQVLDGYLDDVAIYQRALPGSEIMQLYNQTVTSR